MKETDLLKFKNDIIRKFAYLIRMLNKELKADIKRKGRVDTGLMMNQTRVKKLRFKVSEVLTNMYNKKDGQQLDIRDTINEYVLFTTNYYIYQDLGTRTITPARFTRDTIMKRHIMDLITECQMMVMEYSILANLEGIGDETGITS